MLNESSSGWSTFGKVALVTVPAVAIIAIIVSGVVEDERKKNVDRFFAIHEARRQRLAALRLPEPRYRAPRMTRAQQRRQAATTA